MTEPVSVEQHRDDVLALGSVLPARAVPVDAALGLVLASDVVARLPVPPFTNSSMDGFAVRRADVAHVPVTLPVAGDVPAGALATTPLAAGTAQRIMTGAPVPEGADLVVQVELTDHPAGVAEVPGQVRIEGVPGRDNIRRRGEDVEVGAVVLPAGTVLGAAAVAAAVSVGHGTVQVVPRPRVLVVTTGAELVAAGEPVRGGQIPDSNGPMVAALLAGTADVALVRTDDEVGSLRAVLREADADLVVTIGGVSAGAYDVVKAAVSDAGVTFRPVAMQPGKPQGYGHLTKDDGSSVPLVALPGNPVSVFVSTHLFVLPLLARLAGREPRARVVRARAGEEWRSPEGRRQYLPCVVGADGVRPAHRLGSGSHLIASLHLADGLAVVPEDVTEVRPGDDLEVLVVRDW